MDCVFGFSVSAPPVDDPDWPSYYGDPSAVINQFIYDEASHILFEGGEIVLGHKWNAPDGGWNRQGLLNSLVEKSRDQRHFRPPTNPSQAEDNFANAKIKNLLAWPDQPPPKSETEIYDLIREGGLGIEQILPAGIPAEILDQLNQTSGDLAEATPLGRYARIRALTAMRAKLVDLTDFRICLGGAFGKENRRLPGIIEEALMAIRAEKPLFVSSAFGGASKALADALLHRDLDSSAKNMFLTPKATIELMDQFAEEYPPAHETEFPSSPKSWSALTWLQQLPLESIAKVSGLELNEFINLLTTPNLDRAMGWMFAGVDRIRSRVTARPEPTTRSPSNPAT